MREGTRDLGLHVGHQSPNNPTHDPVLVLSVSDKAEQVMAEAEQGFGGGGQQDHGRALSCPQTSEVIPGISSAVAVCMWLWVCFCLSTGLRC